MGYRNSPYDDDGEEDARLAWEEEIDILEVVGEDLAREILWWARADEKYGIDDELNKAWDKHCEQLIADSHDFS